MIKFVTAAFVLLASPIGAIAAPFCLVLPLGGSECIYYDGAQCSRDANRQNGSCQTNPAEVQLPTSRVGDYCLVMPSGYATCGYSDGSVCSRDALLQKGACERSSGSGPKQVPDAYDPNAGR